MRAGRLGQPASCSQWQTMGIIGKQKCIPAYRLAVHRTNACPAWQPHSPCVCNLHIPISPALNHGRQNCHQLPPYGCADRAERCGRPIRMCLHLQDAAPEAGPAALLWFQLEPKPQHNLPLVVAAGSNAGDRAERGSVEPHLTVCLHSQEGCHQK